MRIPFVVLPAALLSLVAPSTGCDDETEAPSDAKPAAAAESETPATDAKPAKSGGAATAQSELKVTIGDEAVEGLFAFAQLDEGGGERYRVTFMDVEATCETMESVMRKQYETMTFFTVEVQRALQPDGTLTWAHAGTAFASGGSTPASLVALPSFEVGDGNLSGTLPPDVGHEDAEKGALKASGSFTAPLCDPIKARTLRLWGSSDEAVPLPVEGSTAKVTIAGQSFDVGGATAFPTPSNEAWDVRLTEKPHGCSMEVRDALVLTVRVGGDAVKLGLGGQLIAGGTAYREVEGLGVEHTKTDDAITLTLSGKQGFAPNDVPYEIAAEGSVTATVCKTP